MIMALVAVISISNVFAQRNSAPATYTSDEGNKGFKKENIFIGSGLTLGFSSGSFNVGANPEIGYSIAQWLDAGISFNINYFSLSGDYNFGNSQKAFNYGGGPFMRIYPVPFLFIEGEYEHNWIDYTTKLQNGTTIKNNSTSSSFLAGIGYSQRIIGQTNFYTALMLDLGNDIHSPYIDSYGSAYPFVRIGFNFYLRPSRKK